ncbi:MAG: class I SAM-dependent methyltransferase [Candidatus Moranbacteria bacterium]|nr:class I SAM-dependent methyltransferase [Candidatus Moranbacteria bacterium]
MKKEIAEKILKDTEAGYDLISEKFSQTRKHFWRGLEFIKDYCAENDKVLDWGCGNGRLLELIGDKNIDYFGFDVSQSLIWKARNKYKSDNLHFSKINPVQGTIPLADNFFNTIYSIAVFHHFPSKKYRQDVARELFAKTKKGGRIVITVWYLFPASTHGNDRSSTRGGQKRYFKNILKNWLEKLRGKSFLDWNDCEISFTDNQGQKFQRFHHAFTKRELKQLFQQAGFEIEKCEIVDGRNILLIGRK